MFGHMREIRWLLAVNRARTGKKKLARAAVGSKIQTTPCAFNNGVEHQSRLVRVELGTSFGRGMDDMRKFDAGKLKSANVADDDLETGLCQMRQLLRELVRISGQDRGLCSE